jgi:SpoVK/Ycf46/Vps4 family AAA+-type ATPase
LTSEIIDRLRKHTSGLTLVQIRALLKEAQLGNVDFGHPDYIYKRKREMIEAECRGLLEFIEPKYKLDMVAVHKRAVEELKRDSRLVVEGHLDAVPMGYLIAGPAGSGKSFLIKAFAGEVGIPCVELKNFREKWVGATEQNLEKIITVLSGLSPVACIIDEADAYLGTREGGGDSGVSSRVFSRLTSFMGNTSNRGKILWFLITNRPDLLAMDLKRQGRAEKHIPLFGPETEEDYEDLFEVFKRKLDLKLDFKHLFGQPPEGAGLSLKDVLQHSGADLEALLVRARGISLINGRKSISLDDLVHCLADYISPVYPQQMEYQTLQAVSESTSRALIPKRWQRDPEELSRRIEQLRPFI